MEVLPSHLSDKETGTSHAALLPTCSGWLEKYSKGSGLFRSSCWHKRYFFLTKSGLGYLHSDPNDGKGSSVFPALLKSTSKRFIPFDRRGRDGVALLPVYFIQDVGAIKHASVAATSVNGICAAALPTEVREDSASIFVCLDPHATAARRIPDTTTTTTTAAVAAAPSTATTQMMYYFGICFERGARRNLLLLRTSSAREYLQWVSCLPFYMHQGSCRTGVPVPHPLSLSKSPSWGYPLRHGKFVHDPDPCTVEEYTKIRQLCQAWNEGERERMVSTLITPVKELLESEASAVKALDLLYKSSENFYMQTTLEKFNECSEEVVEEEQSQEVVVAKEETPSSALCGLSDSAQES